MGGLYLKPNVMEMTMNEYYEKVNAYQTEIRELSSILQGLKDEKDQAIMKQQDATRRLGEIENEVVTTETKLTRLNEEYKEICTKTLESAQKNEELRLSIEEKLNFITEIQKQRSDALASYLEEKQLYAKDLETEAQTFSTAIQERELAISELQQLKDQVAALRKTALLIRADIKASKQGNLKVYQDIQNERRAIEGSQKRIAASAQIINNFSRS